MSTQSLRALLDEASKLDNESIRFLVEALNELIFNRLQDGDYTTFIFEASSNPNFAIPYVAQLGWQGDGFSRSFFELERSFGKNSVTVEGNYALQEGDIVELCRGGNTQRKFRSIYACYMGRLLFLGKTDDAKAKLKIKDYLTFKIDLQTLRAQLA